MIGVSAIPDPRGRLGVTLAPSAALLLDVEGLGGMGIAKACLYCLVRHCPRGISNS